MDLITNYANAAFAVVFPVIFGLGIVSGLSPCSLPTVALVVNYVSKSASNSKMAGFLISLSFVMGMAFVLTALGFVSGYAGTILTEGGSIFSKGTVATRTFISLVFVLFIALGLWMLRIIKLNGFNFMGSLNVKKESGMQGAFLLGLPFGLVASPCTFPVTVGVLLYAATRSAFPAMALMFVYTVGRSIPILIAGTSTGFLKRLNGFSKWQNVIEKTGGIVMILIGVYFLLKVALRIDLLAMLY